MSRIFGCMGSLLVLMVLGSVLIFPLFGDIIKITWANLPWEVQVAVVAALSLITLVIARVIWWALSGRSTFRRRY